MHHLVEGIHLGRAIQKKTPTFANVAINAINTDYWSNHVF